MDKESEHRPYNCEADKQSLSLIKERTRNNPLPAKQNQYQAGDLILYHYPANKTKTSKLSSPYLGPYMVIQQKKNDIEARHMTMGTIRVFHVDEVQLFIGTPEQAAELSQTDADQHMVTRIIAYIGDPAKRTTCEFEVEFQDGSILWLPWSGDLFDTVHYETFCRYKRELYPLLFTVEESKKRIASIRTQAITTVVPGDLAYISLRCMDPYWYDSLTLEDPYHVDYVLLLKYVRWSKPTSHQRITIEIPVLNYKSTAIDNYFMTFMDLYQSSLTL